MVGIQRRFDDHNKVFFFFSLLINNANINNKKRRAVKREKDTSVSTNFFDGLEFAFLSQVQGNKMKVKENDFVSKVKMYGGKVVATLSKNVCFYYYFFIIIYYDYFIILMKFRCDISCIYFIDFLILIFLKGWLCGGYDTKFGWCFCSHYSSREYLFYHFIILSF